MKKKYLLPQLKTDDVVDKNGCWKEQTRIYDYLLKNLKLYYEAKSSIFENGSSSYPHIFEQMLLFHSAFLDRSDPDHDRAVAEWRACLAILALPRIMNVKLDMVKVDFQNSNNAFLRAAASFCPEESPVFYLTTWDYIYVLCMDGNPIALLSPITLICPAKQFLRRIKNLKWITIEKINSKEQVRFDFYGKGNEYSNLEFWLEQLKVKLKRNPDNFKIEEFYRWVMNKLNEYIKWVKEEGTTEIGAIVCDRIYYSMNSNLRKEYSFFNFCCDFRVNDPSLEFLKQRYREDIFQDRLLVVLYDKAPDAMYQTENLSKLDKLFQQLVQINGNRIVAVTEFGGERLPIYIFLPFRDSFARELSNRQINLQKVLEECKVEYIQSMEEIHIVIRIKGFPYVFQKHYSEEKWKRLYGTELGNIYFWPRFQINETKWKAYYAFYVATPDVEIDLLDSKDSMIGKTEENPQREMHILRTHHFPMFIRYAFEGVSGYLPLAANDRALNEDGGTANVFVHIGHSTTYVEVVREDIRTDSVNCLGFERPESLRVVGGKEFDGDIYGYFIPAGSRKRDFRRRYFRNIFHSFWRSQGGTSYTEIRPMQDGQIIFDSSSLDYEGWMDTASFFQFEYDLMEEKDRKDVHLFLEEILLYVAHQVMCQGCTNIKLEYIHFLETRDNKLGELDGLWKNAFEWMKKWTGVNGYIGQSIGRMDEAEALGYLLCRCIYQNNLFDEKDFDPKAPDLYVGVDIGWSKTLVCMFCMEEHEKKEGVAGQVGEQMDSGSNPQERNDLLIRKWTQIDFAGKDISMMDSDVVLPNYPEVLSILLRGFEKIGYGGTADDLLLEFKRINANPAENRRYYLGLFDLLAIQIEDAGFRIPPDVYNRKQQFKGFVEVMTYNIYLLFLTIGYEICKMISFKDESCLTKNKIHIFLSGNGTKFLKWVSNTKEINVINEINGLEYFICETSESLPEVVKKGLRIGSNKINVDMCEIKLLDEKEQLIDGCIFKSVSMLKNNNNDLKIMAKQNDNEFAQDDFTEFIEALGSVKDGFSNTIFKKNGWAGSSKGKNIVSEVIKNEEEGIAVRFAEAVKDMGEKENF